MLIVKKKNLLNNQFYIKNLYFVNIKYAKKYKNLYLLGKSGIVNVKLLIKKTLKLTKLKIIFNNILYSLNVGWVTVLHLNGLGYRCTRKLTLSKDKYWRFNVGHSHVFQFFSIKEIVVKTKKGYICLFSFNKKKLFDLTQKIKKFKTINIYKGSGIQYVEEYITLKSGKIK